MQIVVYLNSYNRDRQLQKEGVKVESNTKNYIYKGFRKYKNDDTKKAGEHKRRE